MGPPNIAMKLIGTPACTAPSSRATRRANSLSQRSAETPQRHASPRAPLQFGVAGANVGKRLPGVSRDTVPAGRLGPRSTGEPMHQQARRVGTAAIVAVLAACGPATSRKVVDTPDKTTETSAWPPLPTDFVSGRPARPEDVAAGRAVFAGQTQPSGGIRALQMEVPQYAYCEFNGTTFAGVIVQAENAQGMDIVGFRPYSREPFITLLRDCRLLGQTPPSRR